MDVKDNIVLAQFHPRIMNPRISNPLIFNPRILNPCILHPRMLHPRMFTARIWNPRILNTRILHFSWFGLRELVQSQVVIQYTRSVSIPNSCKGSRTVS